MPSAINLRVLGQLRLEREGASIALPHSKKTRALLAYLAVTGRRHRRDRLCSLLWELPDDPKGALRWSLSKIRTLVNEPDLLRIVADRESVRFDQSGVKIDWIDVKRSAASNTGSVSTEALVAAADHFAGEFLEGLDLPECHEFQAWCIAEREEARATHGAILSTLLDRLKADPEAALPHARKLVELRSHDELAWARLVRLLASTGRRPEAEDQCELGLRVLSETGSPAVGPLQKARRNLRKSRDSIDAGAQSTALAEDTSLPNAGVATQPRSPSVAILPLRAVGEDVKLPYLADLITEDVVSSLSRDRNMSVIAHALGPGDERLPGDLREVARQIGAQYLVLGSVRQVQDSIAVDARLIDATETRHIWSERSVQKVDAKLQVDNQIARKIAASLRVEIEANEAQKAKSDASGALDVRASYHLGLRELYRFNQAGLIAAQKHFEHAAMLDPNFAAAHARLAYVHIQRYWYGSKETREAELEKAVASANRAIELDPKDALGHFALGRVHALRRQFDLALPELETAVRLDPSMAQGFFGLGQATSYAGWPREAIKLLGTAIELNPHDPHLWAFHHDRSEAYFALGSLSDAERSARAAASLPNATHWPWVTLASVLAIAGKRDDAAAALRELIRRRPDYDLEIAASELSHLSDESFVECYLEGLKEAGLS